MKHFLFFSLALLPLFVWAQVEIPTVDPLGTYYLINDDGEEETGDVNGQTLSAPFRVVFTANPTIPDGYKSQVWYDWSMWKTDNPSEILLRRNDENFEYDFNGSGSYTVQLRAIFYGEEGVEDYEFPQIEEGEDPKYITFTVSESKLDFPNAISPNGDGNNDKLKPKDGYKGIVSFKAIVFNRWGQKIYSWNDVHGSWDGKHNGQVVKDGVYFLNVSAVGSDGVEYKIKKAINVISGFNSSEGTDGSNGGGNE